MLQQFHERNRDLIVNIDGVLTHRDKAGVSPFDSSVQNGDAVWEGLRLYDGRIFRLAAHLQRLRYGADRLQYAGVPTDQHIINELKRTLVANDMRDNVHIRLTLSRGVKYTSGLDPRINTQGCTLIILAEHKPPVYEKTGIKLITAKHRRPPADVLDQKIHSCNQLTSILAKLEANAADVDDALMLDTRGFVAETNATHLFLVKDGTVRTPTTAACPEGITRSVVLEICEKSGIPHAVTDLKPADFHDADEIFCTGTMGEIVPVVELDEHKFTNGAAGEMTQRIARLFEVVVQREAEPIL